MEKDYPNKMMKSEDVKTKDASVNEDEIISGGGAFYPDYGVTANSLEEAIEKFNKLKANK